MSITFDTITNQPCGNEVVRVHMNSDFDINMNNSNAGLWLIRLGLSTEDYSGDMDPDEFAIRLNRWFMRAEGCVAYDLVRFGQLMTLAGFAKETGRQVGWC